MRIAIFGVGGLATVMAITVQSIYDLWYLCSDLVYVILFPQLLCVIYVNGTNTYGSLSAFIIGLFFRIAGGEPTIGVYAIIKYPWYAEGETYPQLFPFKTLSMLISLTVLIGVSYIFKYIFESGMVHPKWDVFRCIVNTSDDSITLKEGGPCELTAITPTKEFNGKINPALKISHDDLLSEKSEIRARSLSSSPE